MQNNNINLLLNMEKQLKSEHSGMQPHKKKNTKKSGSNLASALFPTIPSADKVFVTNLYRLKLNGTEDDAIHRYSVFLSPEIPESANKLRSKVINKAHKEIDKIIGHFALLNHGLIYARKKLDFEIAVPCEHDHIKYIIKLRWTNEVKCGELEHIQYLGLFIRELVKSVGLQKVGNKYFDPLKAETLSVPSNNPNLPPTIPANVNLWTGYAITLHETEKAAYLKLDVAHRVAQKESILPEIRNLMEIVPKDQDPAIFMNSVLKGKYIYSMYNNTIYQIDGIDFKQSPKSTFITSKGETTTYAEYFLKKYNAKITDLDQPLLIHYKNTGDFTSSQKQIYLIPELCASTGIIENMRKDAFLMKDIVQKTSVSPQNRIKACKELIDLINTNKNSLELKEYWRISIDDIPMIAEGAKILAGKLIMQSANPVISQSPYDYVDLDECKNLDRETQRPMLSAPSLQKWGIYYDPMFETQLTVFTKELRDAFALYKISCAAPKIIKVNSSEIEEWLSQANKVPPDAQAIILVIKSDKGKAGSLYCALKSYFISKKPIPSQFVLSKTIERGKNLRSICCKIAIQLCAKLGGIPWEITDVPLVQFPIMIAGICLSAYDVTPLRKPTRVLTLSATLNKGLSRYFSSTKILTENDDYELNLKDIFARALAVYKATNKCYPKLLIVYKEFSQCNEQQIIQVEDDVLNIQKVLEACALEANGGVAETSSASPNATIMQNDICKIVYILVKERCGLKFYEGVHNEDLRTPMPGCVISQRAARRDKKEFFLVSQRTSQGFSIPTHYLIAHTDDYKLEEHWIDNIIGLTYKLCYLYYNISGPIRIPAPLQYAIKLNKLLIIQGNYSTPPPTPDQRMENLNILYYL